MTLQARFTTVPFQPLSDKNVEDNVVFLTRKMSNSDNFFITNKCASPFCIETAKEKKSLKKQKHGYLIQNLTDKAFKGTVVNRALTFMHKGLFESTPSVSSEHYFSVSF